MKFRYFYGSSADQYSFIRIPKLLITDNQFSELTIQAKMLYGLLLDRMAMAIKNKWIDSNNRVYVIYPIAEIQNVTNSGEGEGLLFYGNIIIPFKDKFDKSLKLYSLMTTKPEEVEERKKLEAERK